MRLAAATLALASLLAGCAVPPPAGEGPPGAEPPGDVARTPASAPLTVELALPNPEGFFGAGANVTLTFAVPVGAHTLRGGYTLPEGVELLAGEPAYEGPIEEGDPVRLRVLLRAPPGEYVLRGWGELLAMGTNGSRAAPGALLGVRGNAHEAETFAPVCGGRDPDPCPLPDVALSLAAEDRDPLRLVARLSSSTALRGRAMWWTGAELTTNDTAFNVTLEPGQPLEFRNGVRVPEGWLRGEWGGHYQAVFYFYADPSVDSRVHHDEVFIVREGDRAVVTEEDPERGGPDGGEPPGPGGTVAHDRACC